MTINWGNNTILSPGHGWVLQWEKRLGAENAGRENDGPSSEAHWCTTLKCNHTWHRRNRQLSLSRLLYVMLMQDLREEHVSPSEARKNPGAQSQTLVFDDDVQQNWSQPPLLVVHGPVHNIPMWVKKLHHVIFAITLSNQALFWSLAHIYLSKFAIASMFHIVYKVKNREPAEVSTAQRSSTVCAYNPQAALSRDAGLHYSQWRINHCAGCTMGGALPPPPGAPWPTANFLPRCFDVWRLRKYSQTTSCV